MSRNNLSTRSRAVQGFAFQAQEDDSGAEARAANPNAAEATGQGPRSRGFKFLLYVLLILLVVGLAGFFAARHYFAKAMAENLPQLDGELTVYGLSAPVTVQRDARGVPHIKASSMDDLIFAQGFVTAQDRLWQMDLLRRHASGELAAILGRPAIGHDRLQRILQLREAADRATAALPKDQMHWLQVYARGVNASMAEQHRHLPVEFRALGYEPAPWTPRDSVLVEMVMYQDLTTGFPEKLGREALSSHLSQELMTDLYPTGSWRDHPPGQPLPDLTTPQPDFKEAPLDRSQTKLRQPSAVTASPHELEELAETLALFHSPCAACVAGSNVWAVSGNRTASGKPMLSNDMHLSLSAPELWYEADLQAANPAPLAGFHVAGVTIPGAPFVIAGHNDHVAWGFANLSADVQDVYIEHTRGTPSGAEYQAAGGVWKPLLYHREIIHVRGGSDVTIAVPLTQHAGHETPVISSMFPDDPRTLSLQWTIYDPANITVPFFAVDFASDPASLLNAFSTWGGPPQSLIYADDQSHIGYHAVGHIPVRGDMSNPGPLSPVPTDATAADSAQHEWAGYIPFDQLPQSADPADGVLVAANARITPDGFHYPISLNWMAPYRTERIYKLLEASPSRTSGSSQHLLTPADMLTVQNDVYSELDQVIAQRLAYAIDHATGSYKEDKRLHQAADILRDWNASVDADAAAPAIVNAARSVFWPMLLIPKLVPQVAPQLAQGADLAKLKGLSPDQARAGNLWRFYVWGERDSVEEQLITHTPQRWLPAGYANWDNFLAAVAQRGLREMKAPSDLSTWGEGKAFPIDVEHPVFSQSRMLQALIGVATGTGPQPKSGDTTTVKQMGASFGPSERFTADLSNPDATTLNLVLGESGNPVSPWYMDQFQDWLHGRTYPMPFTAAAMQGAAAHTLTLNPR